VVRLLARIALQLIGNAVGLIVAALLLDDMALDGAAFVLALIIFTIVEFIVQPLMLRLALRSVPALQGGTALVTTFVALVVTDLISDGLQIEGAGTWALATFIVWLGTLLAGVLLPMVLFKNVLADRRDA
jgi:putative membrane protein